MTKAEKRKRMKACAIARFIIEQNFKLLGRPWWEAQTAGAMIESQASAMNATPAHLFNHDSPKLDKRRWKRYNRKQMKGAYLLTPNNAT